MKSKKLKTALFIVGLALIFIASTSYSAFASKKTFSKKGDFTVVNCNISKMLLTVKDKNGKEETFIVLKTTEITKDVPDQEEKNEEKKDEKHGKDESMKMELGDLVTGETVEIKFHIIDGRKTALKIDLENEEDEKDEQKKDK